MEGNHKLFTNGYCKRNPGPCSCRAVLKTSNNHVIDDRSLDLGEGTNNLAEYNGVLLGLEMAQFHQIKSVDIYLYSELVGKQLTGVYRIKNQNLIRYYEKVKELIRTFDYCEIHLISKNLTLEDEKIAFELSRKMKLGK